MKSDLKLELQTKLSPQMMQSLNILALNRMELVQFIDALYAENPCVELEYWEPEHGSGSGSSGEDETHDPLHFLADPAYDNCLQDYLLSQLKLENLPAWQAALVDFIINNLDHCGFYPLTVEETLHYFPALNQEQVEATLRLLQRLEPAGVCCQNLSESLCCQLERLLGPGAPLLPRMQLLVRNCLELLAQGKTRTIQQQHGITPQELEAFRTLLPRLNPKPGASFGCRENCYIIPDILVIQEEGCPLRPVLNDRYVPRVVVSEYYQKMTDLDPDTQRYVEHKLSSAQAAIDCLARRGQTLLALAQELVAQNEAFFSTGHGSPTPLTMREISQKLAVNPSTISRAVKGKYIQCRYGTYPLKSFFTKNLPQEEVFPTQDKESGIFATLRQLVDSENKQKPYSDDKLAALLRQQGYDVARRTVMKYRTQLNIPSSVERKQ